MIIRFDINSPDLHRVSEWMVKNFGPPIENDTWFWSSRLITKNDNRGNEVFSAVEGIEIYKDHPQAILAAIKWGRNVTETS